MPDSKGPFQLLVYLVASVMRWPVLLACLASSATRTLLSLLALTPTVAVAAQRRTFLDRPVGDEASTASIAHGLAVGAAGNGDRHDDVTAASRLFDERAGRQAVALPDRLHSRVGLSKREGPPMRLA